MPEDSTEYRTAPLAWKRSGELLYLPEPAGCSPKGEPYFRHRLEVTVGGYYETPAAETEALAARLFDFLSAAPLATGVGEGKLPLKAHEMEILNDLLARASVGPHELGGTRQASAGDYCPVFDCETEVYPNEESDQPGPLAIFYRRVDAALFAVAQSYVPRLLAQVAALEAALEVEKAKTALLWPVATKQAPTHDAQ